MVVRGVSTLTRGVFDAVVRPSEFVRAQAQVYSSSLGSGRQVVSLLVVWLLNLCLYAGPLTLAGLGIVSTATAPAWFDAVAGTVGTDPDGTWQFLLGFVQNSIFLTVATAIVFLTFHTVVVLNRQSRGVIQSLHTTVYSTGFYLASIFTLVTYLTTAQGLETARRVVRRAQANVIVWVIDLLGANLTVPGARPGPLVFAGLSRAGALLLAVLVLLTCYFLYSLYLGARLNHRADRIDSVAVVLGIAVSPLLYVAGSVVATIAIQPFAP